MLPMRLFVESGVECIDEERSDDIDARTSRYDLSSGGRVHPLSPEQRQPQPSTNLVRWGCQVR